MRVKPTSSVECPTVLTHTPTSKEYAIVEVFDDSGTETNNDHTNTDTLAGAAVAHTKGQLR